MLANSRWANCRWCGSNWEHLQAIPRIDEDPEMLSVTCCVCGACGPEGKGSKGAVRKWNKGPLYNRKGEKVEEASWGEG